MINKRLKILKSKFTQLGIDGYVVPKNDEYFAEYSQKDRLKIISNFSGSAGYAVILKNKNYLFVDGRYTLQAKSQSGNNFKIITLPHKMPGDIFKEKKFSIGYDPNLITKNFFNIIFKKTNIKFLPLKDNLIDKIWQRKKPIKIKKFYLKSLVVSGV